MLVVMLRGRKAESQRRDLVRMAYLVKRSTANSACYTVAVKDILRIVTSVIKLIFIFCEKWDVGRGPTNKWLFKIEIKPKTCSE
jgi:hypothetical protein